MDTGDKCRKLVEKQWEILSVPVQSFLGVELASGEEEEGGEEDSEEEGGKRKTYRFSASVADRVRSRWTVAQAIRLKIQFIHFCAGLPHFPAFLFEMKELDVKKNAPKPAELVLAVAKNDLLLINTVTEEQEVFPLKEIEKWSYNYNRFSFKDKTKNERVFKTYQGSRIANEIDKNINQYIFHESGLTNFLIGFTLASFGFTFLSQTNLLRSRRLPT